MSKRWAKLWPALWVLALCAAAIVAYSGSLRFFFSQDDFVFLARAAQISSPGDLVRALLAPDHFYRPIPRVILFFVQWRLFGLNAAGFHLVSLGLHTLNVLLLFLVVRQLLSSTLLAGLCGLFFATHPMPSLAVYWASGVQDLSMMALTLASLVLYLRSLDSHRVLWRSLSLAAYALALLAKETAVTFPVLLIAVEWVRNAQNGHRPKPRQLVLPALGYAAVVGAYLLVRWHQAAPPSTTEGPYALSPAPVTILSNLLTYGSDALYVRDWLGTAPARVAAVCAAVVVLLILVVWRSRGTRWAAVLGVGWFVLTALPLLVLSQRAYGYYAYLPLAGASLALATLVAAPLEWAGVPDLSGARAGAETARRAPTIRGLLRAGLTGTALVSLVVGWTWLGARQVRAMETKDPAGILFKSAIAQRAAAEVKLLYPSLPRGTTLYVTGLAEQDVWAVGHGDLFRLLYPGVEIRLSSESGQSPAPGIDGSGLFMYEFQR